jgi:hypothetical protein
MSRYYQQLADVVKRKNRKDAGTVHALLDDPDRLGLDLDLHWVGDWIGSHMRRDRIEGFSEPDSGSGFPRREHIVCLPQDNYPGHMVKPHVVHGRPRLGRIVLQARRDVR